MFAVMLLFSTVVPLSVHAATCEHLFSADRLIALNAVTDVALHDEYVSSLHAMNVVAEGLELTPIEASFESEGPGLSPAFDFRTFKIRIPFERGNLTARNLGVIFTHEYTHAIFESYMLRESAQWLLIRKQIAELPDLVRMLDKKIQDLEWSKFGKSDAARSAIVIEQDSLKAKSKAAELQKRLAFAQNRLMLSYHEFVADLFAVTTYRDKNAMRDAASSLGLSANHDAELSLKWRSFEHDLTAAEQSEWEAQVRRIHGIVQFYNPYDLLAPLRRWAGMSLLKSDLSLAVAPEALLDLLRADFEARSATLDVNATTLDPVGINQDLIHQLKLLKKN